MADDIDDQTKASIDLSEDNLDGQDANLAFICHLRNFDWVSAVNSMVLERAARDTAALATAHDSPEDIRMSWEMIARGMTLYWNPEDIKCDQVAGYAARLDPLAVKGGYQGP